MHVKQRTKVAASIILLSAAIAGCENNEENTYLAFRNFPRLMEQPASVATDIFGPPKHVKSTANGKIYEWNNALEEIKPGESPYGSIPNYCVIRLLIDSDGIIKKFRTHGDPKSCSSYNEKLNEHFPYYPNGKWVNKGYFKDQ